MATVLTKHFLKLPLWFQSIKDVSATKSGIMNLPTILGVVVCTILSSCFVSWLGYYTPFMYITPVVASIGAGLLSTLQVHSGHAEWIGYQALYGIGLGFGMSQPMVVVQAVLAPADIPTGTAIINFMQSIGGAIFLCVAQNVFNNILLQRLVRDAPTADAAKIVATGATSLQSVVAQDLLPSVLEAYNSAITQAFYVGVALVAVSIFGALPIQWISVKGKKIEAGA